jgi:hypothetical protein
MRSRVIDLVGRYSVHPDLWAREVLGFEPDDKQEELLRSRANRLLLNCTRQWGKSTTTAIKALHRALHHPGQLVIALSPSARQTAELMRKIETFVKKAGLVPRGDGDNEMSLLFANDSRIVGLPGTDGTIRGFSSVKLLIIDEASRVSEASYRAARPMLAVGLGDLMCLSTPFGKRGFFYEEWANGGSGWLRIQVPASHCPRISTQFLADEKASLGDLWFRQEYCCEFVETQDQLFSHELVENAMDLEVEPLFH